MKKLIILTFILFIIPFALSLEECPRFGIIQQDIPCIQPSSWNPGVCSDYNLTVYDQDANIVLNTTWFQYAPYCAFNMTGLSEPGVYCYNSSIEDGCITLERENNMLSITLSIAFIILFFFALGYFNQEFKLKFLSFAIGLIEIIFMFALLYAKELGKDITSLMMFNFYALLIIGFGVGLISLIIFSLNTVNLEDRIDNEKWKDSDKWK